MLLTFRAREIVNKLKQRFKQNFCNFSFNEFGDVVLDPTVLAASLEGVVPPGLLLAEALVDGLGPMVLP